MVRIRREIRKLGAVWNDTTLWYAKAVAAMLAKPMTDKTSWRYLAGMHGFHPGLWTQTGFMTANEALPPAAERAIYWDQCQHGTWFFLPWHRAYLWSFEDIVRAAVQKLGGPSDWALPYWNYSDTSVASGNMIPPAFLAPTLPDGTKNRLFVTARYGTGVPAGDAALDGFITGHRFDSKEGDPAVGFAGPQTPFANHGSTHGLIESHPHDLVHGDVGQGGLMSYPQGAALDPLFWLHHANIDRLWEVWVKRDPQNRNSTDRAWLGGPHLGVLGGQTRRGFALFDAKGASFPSKPSDMLSIATLGYGYDDVSDPLPGVTRRSTRLEALAPNLESVFVAQPQEATVAVKPSSELLGANNARIALGPDPVTTSVALAPRPLQALRESFTESAMLEATPGEPDRVFLTLENIRGKDGAGIFDVFVGAPGAAADEAKPVGAVSLFGLERASDADGDHGGGGLTRTIEITRTMDALQVTHADAASLDVHLVPRFGIRHEDDISIGQVSFHRLSGQ